MWCVFDVVDVSGGVVVVFDGRMVDMLVILKVWWILCG